MTSGPIFIIGNIMLFENEINITHSFEILALKEAKRLTAPICYGDIKSRRREVFIRNMHIGKIRRRMTDDLNIKKIICGGLKEVKQELADLVKSLTTLLAGYTLAGMAITYTVLAAIAVVIFKFGLGAYCAS